MTRALLTLLSVGAAALVLSASAGATFDLHSTTRTVASVGDCNANGVADVNEPAWANRDDDADGICNGVDTCPYEADAANDAADCTMRAITVPEDPNDPSVPHPTYAGALITVEGIARYGGNQFMWDFGDGSQPTAWTAIANPFDLGVRHAYTGAVGTTYVATLSVRSSTDPTVVATATYPVRIEQASDLSDPAQLAVRAAMADDAALWYLHTHASRGTFGDGAPGYQQPYETPSGAAIDTTCVVLDAYETHGSLAGGDWDTDPYVEDARRSLALLLYDSAAASIGQQGLGNPDTNGNGLGVLLGATDDTYRNGVCTLALADSGSPDRVASTGPANVYGRSFADIEQDAVDWLAFGQIDSAGVYEGGWGYSANSSYAEDESDRWPMLAMDAAARELHAVIPPFVRAQVPYFLAASHNTAPTTDNGAWGWNTPAEYDSAGFTAAGILAHAFLGDSSHHPDVLRGVGYLYRHWNDGPATSNIFGNLGDSDAMWTVSRALRTEGLTRITNYDYSTGAQTSDSFDWYGTPAGQTQTGYATYLLTHQAVDGSWTDAVLNVHTGSVLNSTALDEMTLSAGNPVQSASSTPTANAGGPYTGGPGSTITLDGTASFDPDGSGLSYRWDLDQDGQYDDSSSATPSFTIPSGAAAGTIYTVCLEVANATATSSASCSSVKVVVQQQPPVCRILAPSVVQRNTGGVMTITVDGSPSYDVNGNPLTYLWTSSGPPITDPTAAVASHTANFAGAGADEKWTDSLTVSNGFLTSSCSATVDVVDDLFPQLTAPANAVFEAGPDTTAQVDGWLASATASDPAAAPSDPVPLANDFVPNAGIGGVGVGNTVRVTWTATNPYNSSLESQRSATVTVVDTTPPALALPHDFTAPSATVTYTATASDFVDGAVPVTCTPASGSVFPAGATTVGCSAVDSHGNEATGSFVVTVADATPPVITPDVSGTLGKNGWYTSDVAVDWSVADPESTVTSQTGCAATTVTADTNGTAFACTATSAGGTNSQTVTILRDTTSPAITSKLTPKPNAAGWNDSDVTLSFDCSDAGSGVDTCPTPVVLGEGLGQRATGTATDKAGNYQTLDVAGINVDETPPTLVGTPTTAPNANGWYRGNVTIHWTCDDALSGIVTGTCPADSTITGSGTNLRATAHVADAAGNVTSADSAAVDIDRTAPMTSASAPSGWSNAGVTVTLAATDNLSGVDTTYWSLDGGATQTGDSVSIADDGAHTLAYWSVDKAGNVEPEHTISVLIDQTAPTITHSLAPLPNGAGWNNSPVTVGFQCDDAISGIAFCTPDVALVTEGRLIPAKGTAKDNAGNTATDTASVSIDETRPSISAAPDRAPNANGWYAADVLVSFTCGDALSGVATCPAPVTVHEGKAQSAAGAAFDVAGNTATATLAGLNVDETAPLVSFTGGGTYTVDQTVDVGCTPTDALSGVASSTCAAATLHAPASSFGLGTTTLSATATDDAGNVGTGSVTFTVGVTCASLESLIGQWVSVPDVVSGLDAKVDAVCAAPTGTAKNGKLGAFDNQVAAQAGKSVTQPRATLLEQYAAAL
jgi:hypothetical protein